MLKNIFLLLTLGAVPAFPAVVLYTTLAPDLTHATWGYRAGVDETGNFSVDGLAAVFTLQQSVLVTQIDIGATSVLGATSSLVSIEQLTGRTLTDGSGRPELSTVAQYQIALALSADAGTLSFFTLPAPLALGPGEYWLSLNVYQPAVDSVLWYANTQGIEVSLATLGPDRQFSSPIAVGDSTAFQLEGADTITTTTNPEPVTCLLTAAGLAALVLLRRRLS